MAVEADVQSVIDKYERSLKGPRLLFELLPWEINDSGERQLPHGGLQERYKTIWAAVVLGVIGAFEGFAEDLVASLLYKQGFSWAYIAHHANLTNPSVNDLRKRLDYIGIELQPMNGWTTELPKKTSKTGWNPWKVASWDDLLTQSECWIQVRHCLAHGLATGLGPEIWPGPLDKRSASNQRRDPAPKADNVLDGKSSEKKRSLTLYPTIACARIYTVGADILAKAAADHVGESVNTSALLKFGNLPRP